ncbi:ABC transporter ATP-binding protein [Desulfonatronum lacustre]|uniref:ABC transporter ATP-binding protein n=1 Tax=Desulfonatronum lacustre TaxID=66849 RepID=UPI0004AE6957|nr:ABC transporter ATP-binding protein [Desulfonatronum lacustre]
MRTEDPIQTDYSIQVVGVSKAYRLWRSPAARLKGPLLHRAGELLGGVAGRRMIQASSACFDDFQALEDVTMEVRPGESVGIIGRNGSGKSTLLQIIAGILQPSAGTARVTGRVAALLELGSGFNPEFTGRENVLLNAAILGLEGHEIEARYPDIVRFADIGTFIDHPVKTYSSGMVMRLAFAVQTAVDPDVLIVDEALAVGDIFFVQKCYERLHRFRERGGTLLFVSHDSSAVLELCDRALLLRQGRTAFWGSAREAVDIYDYERVQALEQSARQIPAGELHAAPPGRYQDLVERRFDPDLVKSLLSRCMSEASRDVADNDVVVPAFVRIFDEQGQARSSLVNGDWMYLLAGFHCRRDLDDPALGIKIRDRRGMVLYEASSHTLGEVLPPAASGTVWAAGFYLWLPFTPGEYSITVGLANGRRGENAYAEHLFYAHDQRRFEVLRRPGAPLWAGVCNALAQTVGGWDGGLHESPAPNSLGGEKRATGAAS